MTMGGGVKKALLGMQGAADLHEVGGLTGETLSA